jgi:hypothetical protein
VRATNNATAGARHSFRLSPGSSRLSPGWRLPLFYFDERSIEVKRMLSFGIDGNAGMPLLVRINSHTQSSMVLHEQVFIFLSRTSSALQMKIFGYFRTKQKS